MSRNFKRIFSRALTVAAASSTVLVMGCSDDIDLDGFDMAPCNSGLDDLAPAFEVDYVELLTSRFGGLDSNSGTSCATATDKQTCEEALEAARQDTTQFREVVTTRADAVEIWKTREELMTFLGAVDSEGDAVLVVWHAGYNVGCNDLERGAIKKTSDGYEVIATQMVSSCDPIVVTQFRLEVTADGQIQELESVELSRDDGACVGRRPDGFRKHEQSELRPAAQFWSTVANLEASAVCAFNNLAAELRAFGAPNVLIEDALQASQDEARHTHQTARLAAHFGGAFIEPETPPAPNRPLEVFALENAVEGCVRETFGAAFGTFQAEHAQDPEVASAMAAISDDETRHSELSWRIAAWLETVLDVDALRRVKEAQRAAAIGLRESCRMPVPLELVTSSGVPTPDQALAIWRVLDEELWS